MTREDVYTTFKPHVMGEELDVGNGQIVSIDFFVMLFGAASSPPTHDELLAMDGGTRGYKEFFDRCKAEGLLI